MAQIFQGERGVASPLMSNNPFRNKVAAPQAPVQPVTTARPVSTNPFLDSTELSKEFPSTTRPVPVDSSSATADMFANLNLNGPPRSPQKASRPLAMGMAGRPENMAPRPLRGPPPSHRLSPSEEERRRHGVMALRRGTEVDIFADPLDGAREFEQQSIRRNSESSVRDKTIPLDPEEDKKRRERKYRDNKSSKLKPSRKLDIIDKLDVTSIYGTGLFHHDGPFDACNPNRNKRRHRYAPMQAFPKDSANMQIGGSGPLKKQMDYDKFHGYGQEAHIDYNEAAIQDEDAEYMRRPQVERSASFNPTMRDAVHGVESAGLGTSTFLEGAPASRIAIERRESELNEIQQQQQPQQQQQINGGGLSRKKSLVQKFRGVRGGSNRVQSPDTERVPSSPLPIVKGEAAGNPFFKEHDQNGENVVSQPTEIEYQPSTGRARALSSPRSVPALERQVTGDKIAPQAETKPTGFLGRMKSLKKTKSRPEKRDVS